MMKSTRFIEAPLQPVDGKTIKPGDALPSVTFVSADGIRRPTYSQGDAEKYAANRASTKGKRK